MPKFLHHQNSTNLPENLVFFSLQKISKQLKTHHPNPSPTARCHPTQPCQFKLHASTLCLDGLLSKLPQHVARFRFAAEATDVGGSIALREPKICESFPYFSVRFWVIIYIINRWIGGFFVWNPCVFFLNGNWWTKCVAKWWRCIMKSPSSILV